MSFFPKEGERNLLTNPIKSNGELDALWGKGEKYQPAFHIKFSARVTEDTEKKLQEMLKTSYNAKSLFTLRTKGKDGKETTFQNMALVKISVNCQQCNFKIKLNKHQIEKNIRKNKKLGLTTAIEHEKQTKHELAINQTFEKYGK